MTTSVVLGVVVALVAAEIAARATGHQPRRALQRPEPRMHELDPVLGWRPKPGRYQLGPYLPGEAPVPVTIGPDGARVTGPATTVQRPQIVLVGCSFTMGWAVADDQTWAWRLQELRPDVEVVNRGVAGYGTLQSLLLLEDLLKRQGQRPARVLYGFLDHGLRNVAAPLWLLALSLNPSTVATPYVTVTDDGRLLRHPPESYPSLPLHEYLGSVALVENALMKRRAGRRQAMAGPATKLLINEMAELCRAAGVPFSIVMLGVPEKIRADYTAYARQHDIDVIDCDHQPSVEEMVPGEMAHPNGAVHRRWGDCVAAALAEPRRSSLR